MSDDIRHVFIAVIGTAPPSRHHVYNRLDETMLAAGLCQDSVTGAGHQAHMAQLMKTRITWLIPDTVRAHIRAPCIENMTPQALELHLAVYERTPQAVEWVDATDDATYYAGIRGRATHMILFWDGVDTALKAALRVAQDSKLWVKEYINT